MAERLIHVCGDPTVDQLSIRREENTAGAGPTAHAGGALLLTELIRTLADGARVEGIKLSAAAQRTKVPKSWSTWRPRAKGDLAAAPYRMDGWHEYEPGSFNYAANRLTGRPDLLVVADAGLGFRTLPDGWPDALTRGLEPPQHILLHLADYNGGQLLHHLKLTGLAARTTVVTSVDDLRACAVRVGKSLSWERMFEEIVQAVHSSASPFGDAAFYQVIVQVGAAGAVVVRAESPNALIFDRTGQEGDFDPRAEGIVPGYGICLTAALAAAWAPGLAPDTWLSHIRDGVALSRVLFKEGYKLVEKRLTFPYPQLLQSLRFREAKDAWNLGCFIDRNGAAGRPHWSLLEETYAAGSADEIAHVARKVAIAGPKAVLKDIPVETVGNWQSADRLEIEGVRSVGNAIRDYLQLKNPGTPLCIGVFGPPGAGKSFAVKEVAKGLGIGKDAQLTFNLSQFESPDELAGAFHQIRDLQLKGKTPLVFWDEFDTPCMGKPFGWLRYFLAPMQDGEFTEQGRVHPVGGGIYVFAGGTRHSFRAFCENTGPEDLAAKKPDFVSRLRAYIDVRGPNGNPNTLEDRLYVIRRAFLLNAYLKLYAPQVQEVEQGVLDGFLLVSRYKHGARSMENLVKTSALSGMHKFQLSCLPPDSIMQMYVPAAEFTSLTRLGYRETLRIGMTGHIGLDPARMDLLQAGIERAARLVERHFPERTLTVFSPMAAGGDRLVAREFLRREGARLIAVLPVARDDYAMDFGPTNRHDQDFPGAELRQEFYFWLNERASEVVELPPTATRNEAYLKAGHFVADHCDVMIAVWDGLGAQGQGGTGDIVQRAMGRGVPLIHIWAGNWKQDPAKRTDVGDQHGRFRYQSFPGQVPGTWMDEP